MQSKTLFSCEFSEEIWNGTYKYHTDKNVSETHLRVAHDLASEEKNPKEWEEKFYNALTDFKIVPGGRITSNAGTSLHGTTYINCFVDGPVVSDKDSIGGIFNGLTRAALTLKSEGGYGFCCDFIRPRGAFIYGVGVETPGAVEMLQLWDVMSAVITKGSGKKKKKEQGKNKIRKGAMMVTMSCWHPDIEEFISIKATGGNLTKFNMSVLCTNDFMDAVEKDADWDLVYPDTTHADYKDAWDGDIKEWVAAGRPTIVYKTMKAAELWDQVMKSTYGRNEPGVLFVDRMNEFNNLAYCEKISATNPCLSSRAWIMTSDGPKQVRELIGKKNLEVIVDGSIAKANADGFWKTGTKQLFSLETEEGFTLELTGNHKVKLVNNVWIEAQNLREGQQIVVGNQRQYSDWSGTGGNNDEGYLLGMLVGDGTLGSGKAIIEVWEEDNGSEVAVKNRIMRAMEAFPHRSDYKGFVHIEHKFSPFDSFRLTTAALTELAESYDIVHGHKVITEKVEMASSSFAKGFLRGLFDADGSVQGNQLKGISIRLAQSVRENLVAAQRMLQRLGIYSRIYKRREAGFTMLPDGKGGIARYATLDQFELCIANEDIIRFRDVVGFEHTEKMNKLNKLISGYVRTPNRTRFVATFKSLTPTTIEDVYDVNIDEVHSFDANGMIVHNCGEQLLPVGGVCLLGSINLTQFINKDRSDWDYEKLEEYVAIAVRMLDNVNDKTKVPLEEQAWNLRNKRRIGLGYLGYGSALYLMNLRYGSAKALKLTDQLTRFVTNAAYKASALLAVEKGSFPLFDSTKYLQSKFVKQALDADTIEMIEKFGIRNSHLTSVQPTGNSSIYANNVSGGLEPVVSPDYIRTSVVQVPPDGLDLPNVNWTTGEISKTSQDWKWIKEGDESILGTKFNGVIYKIDKNRGLTKETMVEDYGVRLLKAEGKWDPKADWAADIFNLSIKDHISTMKVFAKYIDSAMSKTINLPFDYPYDDFKTLYTDMYKSGVIKGGTTYRHGTMTSVVSVAKTDLTADGRPAEILPTHAPKRPETLPCEIHQVSIKGTKWVILVGMLAGQPYELFAGEGEQLVLPARLKTGKITKVKQGHYNLHAGEGEDELVVKNIIKVFDNPESAWATRLVSMAMRHGASVEFIVEQMSKDGAITDANKVISRVLKKYIPDGTVVKTSQKCPQCSSTKLSYQEGCVRCNECGFSKC